MDSANSLTSTCHGVFDIVRVEALDVPQNVTDLISTRSGLPSANKRAYSPASDMFSPLTRVSRYTVRCFLSANALKESRYRSQKSWCSGLSTALRASGVAASILTYSWVTGQRFRIASGNCAFVTRNVLMCRRCKSVRSSLMRGYMIGSPTSERAQWRTVIASSNLSFLTPGIPLHSLIIFWCSSIPSATILSGSSMRHFHSVATGFL
mmetsp:Transcript_99258/g.258802  ORF Transcript_99258/g.258802 Transcript_99258/m.258802 type:complete len:208 (+) Transcript_99258:377-1000(+)